MGGGGLLRLLNSDSEVSRKTEREKKNRKTVKNRVRVLKYKTLMGSVDTV